MRMCAYVIVVVVVIIVIVVIVVVHVVVRIVSTKSMIAAITVPINSSAIGVSGWSSGWLLEYG